MDRRSARIKLIRVVNGLLAAVAGLTACGLLVLGMAASASAQSVRNTVEQRMEAGTAAIESAAGAAEEPSQAPPAPSASSPAPSSGQAPVAPPPGLPSPAASSAPSPANQESAAQQPQPGSSSSAVAPAATPAAPAEVAQAEKPPAPTTYTIKPGDTLWSISSQQLSDPFNWPKLWNVNPMVTNPDLIYPGKVLTLPGQPAEAAQAAQAPPPSPVTEAPPAEAPAVAQTPPAETAPEETAAAKEAPAPAPAPPAEEAAPAAPPAAEEQQAVAEETPKEPEVPSFQVLPPPPTQSKELLAQSSGFIARDLPVSARVVGTHEDKMLIGEQDTIYLLTTGSGLEAKGRYTIYRRLKPVVHPVSRRVVGDLIQILGEVTVTETGRVATALVVKSFASIEPGDLVMPARTVEAAPTAPVVVGAGGSLSGLVLAMFEDHYLNAQADVIYIDRGESSGVVVGDHFRIFRHGQRAPGYAVIANVQLPDRLVGELEVLSVQGDTATGVLTRSMDTIEIGDRIER